MRVAPLVVLGCCVLAGCHSRSLDVSGAPDCGTSPDGTPDLGFPVAADMGGATGGDMEPSPGSFIRCRGSGGDVAWMQPIGPVDPYDDIFDVAPMYGQDGAFVARTASRSTTTKQHLFARLTGYGAAAGVPRIGFDWMIDGSDDASAFGVASESGGGLSAIYFAEGPQSLSFGGAPVAVASGPQNLIVSYDSNGTFTSATPIGELPVAAMARLADGEVVTAGIVEGDPNGYTVDFGTGPINVGATELVAVGRFDATGKLTKVLIADTGAVHPPGTTRSYVRSVVVDDNDVAWVTFFTVRAFGNNGNFDQGIALVPGDGSRPTIRDFGPVEGNALVARSPDGHVAIVYAREDGVTVEMWFKGYQGPQLLWQRASTGIAAVWPSGIALDAANDVVIMAEVRALGANPSQLSIDLGGGPLIEGWTGSQLQTYGLLAKIDSHDDHVWSKLRTAPDDVSSDPPIGRHLAADANGDVYLTTVGEPLELCGVTTVAPPATVKTRYLVKLAP